MKKLPPIDVLRRLLDFDIETGRVVRRPRLEGDFNSRRLWRSWTARHGGSTALRVRSDGYILTSLSIDGIRHNILTHRIIWALHYGRWPVGELDHRNGNRADNRIENLREATMIEQRHNIKPRTTHGVGRGVSLPPRHKRFQAAITANYQRYYLGSFPTAEEARAAYLEAKSRLHTFQPVPRDE